MDLDEGAGMTGSRKLFVLPLFALAIAIPLLTSGFIAGVGTSAAAADTPSGPSCTFDNSTLPIVTGVTKGGSVTIACTGLPDSTPFLLFETSLVIALDPQTAALLSGTVSPSLLISVLSALPMINPASFSFPISDSNGNLDYTYKTPTSQPLDPNASCPPSREEYNSGLIGCALALVDLTNASEVGAGSALLEYKGFKFFPPDGTLALKPKTPAPGGVVKVADAPGATTYWWLATLAVLEGDLGGAINATSTVSITGSKGSPTNTIKVTPASYNGSVFTPPKLSGKFTLPASIKPGFHTVTVSYVAPLEGIPLGIEASKQMYVKG
jgi:hypothetical protein